MCRLFGFRSVIKSQVHQSLVNAENALGVQSRDHPDGWGVAYYIGDSPHLLRSDQSAMDDRLFKKVSGIVSGQTVVAHIRKATQGQNSILNTHPFQFGNWIFAHNGNIKDFQLFKEQIQAQITPEIRRFILGDTDSETLFLYLLSALQKYYDLSLRMIPAEDLIKIVEDAIGELVSLIGPIKERGKTDPHETFLSFILTNGSNMLTHQGGQDIYYSTYKNKCADRDVCASFAKECENVTQTGFVNHLIFSSEPLQGENIWIPMEFREIIAIDGSMKLHLKKQK